MPTYDLGDGVNLKHLVYDRTGTLAAATVSVLVTRPDATTTSPAVTTTATGVYQAATFTVAQTGIWTYVWTVSGTVVDVASGAFTVTDPAAPVYTDLETVKSMLGKITADDRDDLISAAITGASRMINQKCGRYFYADRGTSTRVFRARNRSYCDDYDQVLMVDDIATATGLSVTYGISSYTTLATFETGPDNAAARNQAITEIRSGAGWLYAGVKVQVTARWGWPAVPDEITTAAGLLAARLYRRKDSPNGIIGSADWGAIRVSRTDPDVEALISPFAIPLIA